MAKKLQAFNELIDEVETRLKETEQYDRRKKKKVRILPHAPTTAQIDYREKQEAHFAQGMTFYKPVSYTHLDVYKRQRWGFAPNPTRELSSLDLPL